MLPPKFWDRVNVPSDDECWTWIASRCQGYGHLRFNGKVQKAHRVIYEHLHGPIDKGLVVMHSCDNRACVNPRHLSVGTVKDNNHDRDLKGRQVAKKGQDHGMAVLTIERVRLIRALHKAQHRERLALAQQLGISVTTVSDVMAGKTWKHVL